MAKIKSIFICQECGYESAKWLGKCPSCNSWNTFVEEVRDNKVQAKNDIVKRLTPENMPKSIGNIKSGEKE